MLLIFYINHETSLYELYSTKEILVIINWQREEVYFGSQCGIAAPEHVNPLPWASVVVLGVWQGHVLRPTALFMSSYTRMQRLCSHNPLRVSTPVTHRSPLSPSPKTNITMCGPLKTFSSKITGNVGFRGLV